MVMKSWKVHYSWFWSRIQSWDLVKRGGFLLTKWISNNPQVIASVPVDERAKEIKGLDLHHDPMPVYLLKKWLWQSLTLVQEHLWTDTAARWVRWAILWKMMSSRRTPQGTASTSSSKASSRARLKAMVRRLHLRLRQQPYKSNINWS